MDNTLKEYGVEFTDIAMTFRVYDSNDWSADAVAQETVHVYPLDNVRKLGYLLGIKVHTALSLIVETGDFSRFKKGSTYAAFLGLAPGESSSGDHINRTGISKAGNTHLRCLLIEGAKGICKGQVGHKSKELRSRQAGNSAAVIAYADRGNTRMRSKYYRMIRHGKKKNVAVAATARELACFVWGIMTNNMEPRTSGKKAA